MRRSNQAYNMARRPTRAGRVALTVALYGLSTAAAAETALASPDTAHGSTVNDIAIMHRIQQDVGTDKTLSPEAQHVTVIARNGNVILQGDVNSAPERDAVVSKAQNMAGTQNIINQITIAGKSDSDNAVMPYNPAR